MAVNDEDSVCSQRDPSDVKKQVPSVRDMAIQVDQPQRASVKVPPGQPSGTSAVETVVIQADLPQRSPVTPRTDNPQQTKEKSRKDHLQAPKDALNPPSCDQQSIA